MSSLTAFRDHCRTMATAKHRLDCPSLRPMRWVEPEDGYEGRLWMGLRPEYPPRCDGDCLTAADRALFAQMADEITDYLAPQVDLFGEEAVEPAVDVTTSGGRDG